MTKSPMNVLVVLDDARTISATYDGGEIMSEARILALRYAERESQAVRVFVSFFKPGAMMQTLVEFAVSRRLNAVQVRQVTGLRLARS